MYFFATLVIFINLTICISTYSQNTGHTAVASALAGNILYPHVANPVEVAVSNVPCESLFVTTSQGSVRGNGCYYLISPRSTGNLALQISVIQENDTVLKETKDFRVLDFPAPSAYYAGKTGTQVEISQKLLSSGGGILAMMNDFPIEAQFEIIAFEAIIIGKDGAIYREEVDGHAIQPVLYKNITEMEEGDMLFFEEIKAQGPGKAVYQLSPISFKVNGEK